MFDDKNILVWRIGENHLKLHISYSLLYMWMSVFYITLLTELLIPTFSKLETFFITLLTLSLTHWVLALTEKGTYLQIFPWVGKTYAYKWDNNSVPNWTRFNEISQSCRMKKNKIYGRPSQFHFLKLHCEWWKKVCTK